MINRIRAWRLLSKGQKLLRKGNAQGAIERFDAALSIAPSHAALHMHKGLALNTLGKHGDAVDCATKATALSPKKPAFHCLLGMVLIDSGRWQEAIRSLDSALSISGKYLAARAYRGLGLLLLGNAEDGFRDIMASRGFGLTSFEARLLCMCESHMLKHPGLARPIEETIKGEKEVLPDCHDSTVKEIMEGNHPAPGKLPEPAMDTAMDCLLGEKDYEAALKLFDLYTEQALKSPHRQAVLGFVMLRLGNYKKSISHLEEALGADRTDFRIHYYLGLAHIALEDRPRAIRCFSEAVDQVNPGIAINRLEEFMRVEREINST